MMRKSNVFDVKERRQRIWGAAPLYSMVKTEVLALKRFAASTTNLAGLYGHRKQNITVETAARRHVVHP